MMANKQIIFRFLNVGQGDATHIILPDGQHMLVDMNLDHKNRGIDVVAYLSDELPNGDKQKHLAYLINTHPHDDHIRGMGGLGNTFEIGEMWHSGHELDCEEGENESYDKFQALIADLGKQATAVTAGSDAWATIGDVTFHVFRPSAYVKPDKDKTEEEKRDAIHNECMVLKITYGSRSVLLTGDSSKVAWESIVKHYNTDGLLKADVLHASHHGSRTFFMKSKGDDPYTDHLDAIDPQSVVISVGADNGYDHPHDDALNLYDNGVREIYRTDEHLSVALTINEDGTMTWAMDDQEFQDTYQLPDPDDDTNKGQRESTSKSWGAALTSKTKLGDRSPTA